MSSISTTVSTSFSLQDKQKESLLRMLHFNHPMDEKEEEEEPWKVLIFDAFCRDLIAPLLRVGDLRKHGVTLHMLITDDREPIEDVPAIYFCLPTEENINRICQDCKKKLYDRFHLNFASSISQDALKKIANSTLESGTVDRIVKVYDQYTNFISLEKDLFSLQEEDSYIAFNDPAISDVQAEINISNTVDALFSVLVTLGVIPIIRCPRNGAAEAIATQLDNKLHDHLISMGHLFSEATSFHRPVLIILDRNVDLSVILSHTWTYQALVHDLLGMKLNKVKLTIENDEKKKEIKHYALDTASDVFWANNVGSPFPKIAVEVKTYVTEYTKAMDEFKSKYGADINLDDESESKILGKTKELGAFVTTLPALREKKKIIDCHTNIAMELLNEIKRRELDTFFSFEEGIITRTSQDKKEILSLLSSPERGTPEDKMRLFLVYLLCNESISDADMKQFEAALSKSGIDLGPASFIKKIRAFTSMLSVEPTNSSNVPLKSLRTFMQKVNVNADSIDFGGYAQRVSNLFTSGVQALMPTTKEFYITRIVDCIMEMKNDLGVDSYLYFDPKVQKKLRQTSIPRKNTPFKEAIVFTVGGGNYVEYQNLQEYAKKTPGKKILYGSTDVTSPLEFLEQLKKLSKKAT